MNGGDSNPGTRQFGAYVVDLRARELRKNGHRIRLQDHSFKILASLLDHPGDVVTREHLRNRLWPDGTVVDFENGLNVAIGKLRQALRDSADNPKYIETVPRQGYRFIAPLETATRPVPVQPIEGLSAPPPPAGQAVWRRALVAGLGLVLLAGGYLLIARFRPRPPAAPSRLMIAVLPFQDYGEDQGEQYLADGLTEEMTTQLSRLEPKSLGVIARTTAVQYRSSPKGIGDIGRELGAGYLLEGSVRRSGNRVRVTAQLIRASDQSHLWASEYDRDLGDVLAMQAEIARAVADRISVALSPETKARLGSTKAVKPGAYEAYLKGRYFLWNHEYTADSVGKAGAYFRAAIDADGEYAPAYAAMAEYYLVIPMLDHRGLDEYFRKANELGARALSLDEGLAEAHMVKAAEATFTRDWRTAESEFQRTLELDPSLVRARALYSAHLMAVGRTEDAVAEIRHAQQMDPLALTLRGHVRRTLYLARRYGEAIDECRKDLELNPASKDALGHLALAYVQSGRYDEALRIVGSADSLSPAAAGYVYAAAGRREEALKKLQALLKSAGGQFDAPYQIATIYAGLGDKEQALSWLEKSESARDPALSNRLLSDPKLDGLRSEPRFRALLAKMNYPR